MLYKYNAYNDNLYLYKMTVMWPLLNLLYRMEYKSLELESSFRITAVYIDCRVMHEHSSVTLVS